MKRTNDFLRNRGHSEHGFTMVEILVGIMLLAGVIAVVTSTLINATQTSDKLTRGTLNQSKLLDAVSLVTRDISLSKDVEYASTNALSLKTIEEGVESNVKYFYWNGSVSSIPADAKFDDVRKNVSLLPSEPSIIEYRVVGTASAAPIVRGLIEGYNPGANSASLFVYFDNKNNELLTDNKGLISKENLPSIRRVQIHLSSFIEGREKQMEIKTSASPRFMGVESGTSQAGSNKFQEIEKTQTPELYGDLIPQTRVAKLEWTPVAGANGYAIYKQNRLENGAVAWILEETTGNNVTTYDDPTVKPGETYEYYVVAHGYMGDSSPSNTVTLRVTPDATSFVYIQPTRGQDGSDISGYTVARDLNNQISWAASAGENIRYNLFILEGSTKKLIYSGPATTYKDTGKSYGATTRYTVVPFNSTLPAPTPNRNGVTGGDAPDSPAVDLISPPLAPSITVDRLNDTTTPSRSGPVNKINVTNSGDKNPTAKCHQYFAGSAQSTATSQITSKVTATQFEHGVAWGSSTYYRAIACNDAGDSPFSNTIGINQIPGPFDINSLVNNEGYVRARSVEERVESIRLINKEGKMSASWSASAGSAQYSVSRSVIDYLGGGVLPGSFNYNSGIGSTTERSAVMTKVHPGALYRVTVTAKAANGTTRSTDATLLTKPDVPQWGVLETMCKANGKNSDQDLAMYVNSNTFPRYGGADETNISFSRKQYNTNNYLSAPGGYTTGLGTNVFAWQQMRMSEEVSITYQNGISDARIRQLNPEFGRSASELKSYPLNLSTVNLASFNGACNTSTGGLVIRNASLSETWVVPYNVCYGYEPGRSYTDAWYFPNNLGAGAVFYDQRQAGMIQNTQGGCRWRFAPGIFTAPEWTAFT
ncbi:MAG: hypothetical protein H9W81_12865 [Enterococcus sp.]|nr:hypothetical protein [Enterococcus sp.]